MSDPISRLNTALEGRYLVERELGAGGMATVYLADDLKHGRKVALKVLKPELAAVVGAERFLAEIKTTANLQHPHILPLHDSGEADGLLFYVMPYLEGETLRDRIQRDRQLPIEEARRIATAVAQALQHAHDRGVIHRDIKPANILLQDGQPIVADFGIALAVGAGSGARLTETGLSVGTPYYMSPEQATGDQHVGPASDIYALGAVLYESLVGEPPYVGSTAQAVLARILQSGPVSATQHRSTVPANVDAAIRMALAKLPADRFATARDFAAALADPSFRLETDAAVGAGGTTRWARLGPGLVLATSIAVMAAAWGWLRPAPPAPVVRYELAPPGGPDARMEPTDMLVTSPDRGWSVYSGRRREGEVPILWRKRRSEMEWEAMSGTEGGVFPVISPDGQRVAFVDSRTGETKIIPAEGGATLTVAGFAGPFAWSDDGFLYIVGADGDLRRVPDTGGDPEVAWSSDSLRVFGVPSALPHGRGILVATCESCPLGRTLSALDLETGELSPLISAFFGSYDASTGILLLARSTGDVLASRFDLSTLELEGPPVPVLEGVTGSFVMPALFLSGSGDLTAILGPPARPDLTQVLYEAVWVARDGTESLATDEPPFTLAFNFGHALSPDGTRLAIGLAGEDGQDVWVKELPDGPFTRLTLAPENDARPRWSPDGQRIWFQSRRDGDLLTLYSRRADGADEPVRFPTSGRAAQEPEPTPDGEWMILRVDGVTSTANSGRNIVAFRTNGDTTEVPLLTTEYDEYSPRISPDGRWLAYVSTESGRPEVYVRPFPNVSDGRWQVSANGGIHPLWKRDGTELYYVGEGEEGELMMAAQVEPGSVFRVRERLQLFQLSPRLLIDTPWEPVIDVTADGSRFLMMREAPRTEGEQQYRLIVVENFMAEVERALRR